MLVAVEPGSPADKGGLLLGDVIINMGGQPVRHMDDLMAQLSGDRVGTAVPVMRRARWAGAGIFGHELESAD